MSPTAGVGASSPGTKAVDDKPETLEERAERLAAGNPLEYERALANATSTEREAFEDAKARFNAIHVGRSAERPPLMFHGRAGQAFAIDGEGFGSGGTLTVGGVVVPTTRWNDRSIKGVLPDSVKYGDVVVKSDGGETITGAYAAPKREPSWAPQSELRQDGPTLEEYVAAGYKAEHYPPSGYARRSSTGPVSRVTERAAPAGGGATSSATAQPSAPATAAPAATQSAPTGSAAAATQTATSTQTAQQVPGSQGAKTPDTSAAASTVQEGKGKK